MFIVLVIVQLYYFFNPGTSELFKKKFANKCFFIGFRTLNLRARGRLSEFRFGMALSETRPPIKSHLTLLK